MKTDNDPREKLQNLLILEFKKSGIHFSHRDHKEHGEKKNINRSSSNQIAIVKKRDVSNVLICDNAELLVANTAIGENGLCRFNSYLFVFYIRIRTIMRNFIWKLSKASLAFAVVIFAIASVSFAQTIELEPPVRIEADGKPIDTGLDNWGHNGPTIADIDGDGKWELVVGDFSGRFQIFKNTDDEKKPAFKSDGYLKAGDEVAKVPIYCCIGASPHFFDYDDDGTLDMISGSYDPGEFYLFRGLGKGKYAEAEVVKDESGKPVLRNPDAEDPIASFGTFVTSVDWDDDGDLDLLIGAFDGEMLVRINKGTRKKPVYETSNRIILMGDKPLKVATEHACPVVCDWDGDGLWDILAGCDDGGVYWFRNEGSKREPKFKSMQIVMPKHEGGNGYREIVKDEKSLKPGIRAQIGVYDFNGDGKLDLLVGDFRTTVTPKKELTATQLQELISSLQECAMIKSKLIASLEEWTTEHRLKYAGVKSFAKEARQDYQRDMKLGLKPIVINPPQQRKTS